MDWSALDRSAASEKPDHDPINRAKPVVLIDERLRCSETLFKGFHPTAAIEAVRACQFHGRRSSTCDTVMPGNRARTATNGIIR